MCSCFDQTLTHSPIDHMLRLTPKAYWPHTPTIRPTDAALVVGAKGKWRPMTFGWPVSWSNAPLINAREETLQTKPTFSHALEWRVAVPASFYVEWKTVNNQSPNHSRKQPYHFQRSDKLPLIMAGLWDGDAAFCLITTAATGVAADIHDRMPLLLSPEEANTLWLAARPFGEMGEIFSVSARQRHAASLEAIAQPRAPTSDTSQQMPLF